MLKRTGYRIVWTNNNNARWALYGDPPEMIEGPRGEIEKPLGTFDRFEDAHDALKRIVGSPYRYDENGNPILRGSVHNALSTVTSTLVLNGAPPHSGDASERPPAS